LIYLSRAERRAEIVTDPEVTAAIPAREWGAAMAAMIGHIGDNRVADGMIDAIGQVGAILTRHFPLDTADANQLPNRVIEV
jgi:putative membrane protein